MSASTLPSLRELVELQHRLELTLIDAGGELPPEIEELFSEVTIARERKVDNYQAILTRCALVEADFKTRAAQLMAIARGAAAVAERLKDGLKGAMLTLETTELEGATVRFKLSRSQPRLVIFDPPALPSDYSHEVVTQEIDKAKIRADLDAGFVVPGARLEESYALRPYPAKGVAK